MIELYIKYAHLLLLLIWISAIAISGFLWAMKSRININIIEDDQAKNIIIHLFKEKKRTPMEMDQKNSQPKQTKVNGS